MPDFDPYREWLDIDPAEQPADHYRLLGLARFEADRGKIERAGDERMAHLRQFQMGPRGIHTQKLLNELAAARVCLLDHERKALYDAELAACLSARAALERAAAQPPPAPIVPPTVHGSRVGSAHQVSALNSARHKNWQLPLLVTACVAALLLAAAGWLIGRYRTTPRQPGAAANLPNSNTPPPEQPQVVQQSPDGSITFDTSSWTSPTAEAAWSFHVFTPGFFQAEVTYATDESFREATLELQINDRRRTRTLGSSSGPERTVTETLTVAVPRSGRHTLRARALSPDANPGLKIQAIRFVPIEPNAKP